MINSILALRISFTAMVAMGAHSPSAISPVSNSTTPKITHAQPATPRIANARVSIYAAAPSCKPGFKAAKKATSMLPGAKKKCYKVASAAAGKALLTKSTGLCAVCHGSAGIAPYALMDENQKAMGLTLSPADLEIGFNAHAADMPGIVWSSSYGKIISQFLLSIK